MPAQWRTSELAQNYSMAPSGTNATTLTNIVTSEVLTMTSTEFGIIFRAEQQILGNVSDKRSPIDPVLHADFDSLKLAVQRIRAGSGPF